MMDKMIPKVWVERVLADLQADTRWNQMMREKGYYAAQLPVRPLRKRVRMAAHQLLYRRREWLAFTVAPWLKPDDYDLLASHFSRTLPNRGIPQTRSPSGFAA